MNSNEWIALVDIFELFQLKHWCTDEELTSIEKVLELEIIASLNEKYAPELPTAEQTLEVIAHVKKDFILEYISESYADNPIAESCVRDISKLLNERHATPEKLETLINTLFLAED